MNRLVPGYARRFVPVLLVTSMLGAASGVSAQQLTDEDVAKLKELFSQGRSQYSKKEYEQSNKSYEEVLQRLPKAELDVNAATVLFNMGGNYALLGKKEKAIEALSNAISKGFWNTDALERSPDLASLRGSGGFDDLVKQSQTALGAVAFGLKDIDGNELKRKDYEGKVIVLDVWGTWCPPCRMEIPHFVKLQKKYKDQGLAIIGLTWERREPDELLTKHVSRFASQNGVNYPLVMISGSRLGLLPGVEGFPTTFFVGRDGSVRERVVGARPYEDLHARVVKLLKEKAPQDIASGE